MLSKSLIQFSIDGRGWVSSLLCPRRSKCPPKLTAGDYLTLIGKSDSVSCGETWFITMNQGKLEVTKQAVARVNTDILRISKLKWTGMGEFNSDNHYLDYCGKESLRRNGVALIVNKRVQNQYLGALSKTTEWSLFVSKANHSISQ